MSLFEKKLSQRRALGHLRSLRTTKNLIDFASNDYLGLSRSADLALFTARERERCEKPFNGLGSTGSRLLTGNSTYAQELEENIASFHGYEAGLLFNCGYMANLGLLSSIGDPEDVLFFDQHIHASSHEGIRLSQTPAFPFRHNDLSHLESRLKNSHAKGKRFICIESIYSTDGSKAPLVDICALSAKYEAHLIVDEAHAVAVFGPQGRGLVAEAGLMHSVFAQITPFGKAVGTYGAIILGSHTLKEFLINFARSYMYTTALPFQCLAAIQSSYALFPFLEKERKHLQDQILQFRKFSKASSETQIQPIKIKGNNTVRWTANQLAGEGFDVRPLMSPTVQKGHEVLRVCLHAFNKENEVNTLLQYLEKFLVNDDKQLQ